MHDPTQQEVRASILKGIIKAERDYRKGTTWMLHQAPEYFMTVNIYQSLLKLTKTSSLTLEDKPKRIIQIIKNRHLPGRKPSNARLGGRCDLVLFYLNTDEDKPRALIEVKRNAEDCIEDLNRVARLKSEGLEFCVLASCLFEEIKNDEAENAKDKLRTRRRDIHQEILEVLAKHNLSLILSRSKIKDVSYEMSEGDVQKWVWSPVCFVIS